MFNHVVDLITYLHRYKVNTMFSINHKLINPEFFHFKIEISSRDDMEIKSYHFVSIFYS